MIYLLSSIFFIFLLANISRARVSALFLITFFSIVIRYPRLANTIVSSKFLINDSISFPLTLLTLWISALIILARKLIFVKNLNLQKFTFLVILLQNILIICFLSSHILNFYICFEASLIPTFLIILIWGNQPERLQAGSYFILYTAAASLPLLAGILIYLNISNTTFFYPTIHTLPSWLNLWFFLCIFAFIVKLPIYTIHLWLPKAHVEAPIAGSIILAGVLLKLGGFGLIRIATLTPETSFYFIPPIRRIRLWGAAITCFICLRLSDLKILIAYSSVSHIGLLLAGLLASSNWGWLGALIIIIAHGLASSAIFAIANVLYESSNSRSILLTKGYLSTSPELSLLWFLITVASIAGPPTINLLREILLIASSYSFIPLNLLPLAVISFITVAYSLYLYTSPHHGPTPKYLNAPTSQSPRYYLILSLHLTPCFIIILAPHLISI